MMKPVYEFEILQDGSLPLTAAGRRRALVEHACASVLVWPVDAKPDKENSLVVDPCFTARGFAQAQERLGRLGATFDDIGACFITHPHFDHFVSLPETMAPSWRVFEPVPDGALEGVSLVSCPGHHPLLQAVRCPTRRGELWIVGDAVIDRDFLAHWAYYWPNGYAPAQVMITWFTVAVIVSRADLIVPGHGDPIEVTAELLEELIAAWPEAPYADRCAEVGESLRSRYEQLLRTRPKDQLK